VANLATVGKSGGAIASYEHITLSSEVRVIVAASKPYATWGICVAPPMWTATLVSIRLMHLCPALTHKHSHDHHW
jgi:hypothetical protein